MRSSGIWRLGLSAAIVLGALFAVASVSPDNTAGPCEVASGAALRDVPEASGLAVSRRRPGLLWTHNDSGNAPDLFAIDTAGKPHGRVHLPIQTRDWEDVSAAACGSGECLFIGDIGDNALTRRSIQVYRVPEPDAGATQTTRPEMISLIYPDGPHNAEAMFIANGRVFIVTKDRSGVVYRSAAALGDVVSDFSRTNTNVALQRIGALGLIGVTDAEASPDAALVAIRTPDELRVYRTVDVISAPDKARPTMQVPIRGLREPQGEGVAIAENGMIYLASEGRPWNRAGRFLSLRCATRPL